MALKMSKCSSICKSKDCDVIGNRSCSECGLVFGYPSIKEESVDTDSTYDFLFFGDENLQKLNSDFVSIAAMCDRLGLPVTVKDQAYENFEKVKYRRRVRDRNALFAACIYVACRQNDMNFSIWEIFSVADGATRSDINKAIGVVAKALNIEKNWLMRTKAAAFINRFCSSLGMGREAVNAAYEAAKSFECLNSGSSPLSVAAAVIYVIAGLSDQKNPLEGIVEATGVTVNTIRKTYRDLYPHLSKIIPKWFAEAKDMKKLHIPRQRTRKIHEKTSSFTQESF